MTDRCAKTQRYYDGELPQEEEAEVIEHLATCETCQRSLGDWMQLDAASGRSMEEARPPVVSLADQRARRRRTNLAVLGVALAAAAALLFYLRGKGGPPGESPPVIALAEARSLEPRLSSAPFDEHRPYRVERSTATPGEAVSLQAMAELERRGDRRGLADAYLLSGDAGRGRVLLEALDPGPDRDSDLAAAALLARDPELALIHANRALAAAPDHPQATWNRALALRDLGLPLAAALAFERAATLGDPAWAAEARERGTQLREPVTRRLEEIARLTKAATQARVESDPPYPLGDAALAPGLARLYLVRALRLALSAKDVLALAPLAQELDRLSSTTHASKLVAEIAAADFVKRRPVAEAYRALVSGKLPAEELDGLLRSARAAGAWDILLGATLLSGRFGTANPELEGIAARRQDPYLSLIVIMWKAISRWRAGDIAGAEETARSGLPLCSAALAYECIDLERRLTLLLLVQHRATEARAVGLEARRMAEASGEARLAGEVLVTLAQADWLAGRSDTALAFAEEARARNGNDCALNADLDAVEADLRFRVGAFAEMRRILAAREGCSPRLHPQVINLRVNLARLTRDPGDIAAASATIQSYATQATTPGEHAASKAYLGGLTSLEDPVRGGTLLHEAIAELRALPAGQRELVGLIPIAFEILISTAAKQGDFAAAAREFEREAEVPLPAACAVAVSTDDDRGVAVVRGKDGTLRGRFQQGRKMPVDDPATLLTAELLGTLEGCDTVAVLARPPLHGRPDLLPPTLAWSFLAPGPAARATPNPRGLLVTDVVPPPDLGLPRLLGRPTARPGDVLLSGAEATPSRVVTELGRATYVELHAHGLANLAVSDASFLALTPEANGRYALTAGDLSKLKLAGAPTVVLAACRAAEVAPYLHERWSLPDAFLRAGARAVFAATAAIPDDGAARFFDALRARLDKGEPPARALRDERQAWLARGEKWVASVILFQAP